MGAQPVKSIQAHDTKIYGIDWNREEADCITTCSLDKSIKFWNMSHADDVPERVINTSFPVWRARHTPFGWGLLAMPQRGDHDLHLYDRRGDTDHYHNGKTPAVARFRGHQEQVREFLWRPRGSVMNGVDHRDFQLVSWGNDHELRLHRMESSTLAAIGYEKGVTHIRRLNITRAGAEYKTFRDEPTDTTTDGTVQAHYGSYPLSTRPFPSQLGREMAPGMRKVAILHPRGWLQGNQNSADVGMYGRADTYRAMNPIDWMKNVKITSWVSETLGEEISQVGEKFSRVSFESVDVPRRKATISMDAPWGNQNSPIFIKIDMKFPATYPSSFAAMFKIQKTAGMTPILAAKLSSELSDIAAAYAVKKRGCLEAVFRYLLREQSMEQIVSWIQKESVVDGKIEDIDLADEGSSDEDDVGLATFTERAGVGVSSDVLNANVLVPLPHVCGAQWADNGSLVCFFAARTKPPASFLASWGTRNNDTDKEKVFEGFGRLTTDSPGAKTTFRAISSGYDSGSDSSSGSSASSSTSSSHSGNLVSLPSQICSQNVWRAGDVSFHRSRSTGHSNRSTLGAEKAWPEGAVAKGMVSIHDLSDMLPSKRHLASEYMILGNGSDNCDYNAQVAMRHGYQEIARMWLLIKLVLQDEVRLETFPNLHGSSELHAVPFPLPQPTNSLPGALTVIQGKKSTTDNASIRSRVRWGESAFGGRYLIPALMDHFESRGDIQMLAMLSCVLAEQRTKSPSDSMANQDIAASCGGFQPGGVVLDYHPSWKVARAILRRGSTKLVSLNRSTYQTPGGVGGGSGQLVLEDRRLSAGLTLSHSSGSNPAESGRQLSRSLSDKARFTHMANVENRGQEANDQRFFRYPFTAALSTSSDDHRTGQRANTGLMFSRTRASLVNLAHTSQSPPTIGTGRKKGHKSSPIGTLRTDHSDDGDRILENMPGNHNSSTKTSPPRQSSTVRIGPSSAVASGLSISFDDAVLERDRIENKSMAISKSRGNGPAGNGSDSSKRKKRVRIKASLHNQDSFDQDGYASVPLLDPTLDWKFRAYRSKYAHLLGTWGLFPQKAEILKFGGIPIDSGRDFRKTVANPSVEDDKIALENVFRKRNLKVRGKAKAPKRGLEFRRCCVQCSRDLVVTERNEVIIGWTCENCKITLVKGNSNRMLCTICQTSTGGLMVPCLNCGHATCFSCQRGWLSRSNRKFTNDQDTEAAPVSPDDVERPCATGCGCVCSLHERVEVTTQGAMEHNERKGPKLMQENARPARAPASSFTGLPFNPPLRSQATLPTYRPDSALASIRLLSSQMWPDSDREYPRSSKPVVGNGHRHDHRLVPPTPTPAEAPESRHLQPAHQPLLDSSLSARKLSGSSRPGSTRTAILRHRDSDATIRQTGKS